MNVFASCTTRKTPLVLLWVSSMPGRTLPWPTDVMNLFFVRWANFTLPFISSSFPPPPRHESRIPQNQSACRRVSGRPQRLTRTTPLLAFDLWTVPCRSALMMLSLATERMTAIEVMCGMCNRPAWRAGGKLCLPPLLRARTWSAALPASYPPPRRSGLATRPKEQEADRQRTASFLESWTHTRCRPSLLASHLGPRGMLSVCRRAADSETASLSRNISPLPSTAAPSSSTRAPSSQTARVFRSSSLANLVMLLALLRAWLLLASSAELAISRAPASRSPTSTSTAPVPEGGHRVVVVVVRTGPVSRAQRGGANPRLQQGCRARIAAWWLRIPASQLPARGSLQLSVRSWPTLESHPLWGPSDEPHGDEWPECCRFLILLE